MTLWIMAVTLCFIPSVLVLLWNVGMYRLWEERYNRLEDDYKVRDAQCDELQEEIKRLQMSGRGIRK